MSDSFNLYINQFATCRIVKGFSKSVIVDLDRNKYYNLPNSFIDIFERYKGRKIRDAKEECSSSVFVFFKQGLDLLYSKELIFYSSNSIGNSHLDLPSKYFSPSIIENIIIDIDFTSKHNYKLIAKKINSNFLNALQLRFFDKLEEEEIEEILLEFKSSNIECIELILPNYEIKFLKKLAEINNKITFIYAFGSKESRVKYFEQCTIIETEEIIYNDESCGQITPDNLSCNKKLFISAYALNTCLYKKLSIDCSGKVKNCPSMKKDFGKIDDTNLEDIVKLDSFKEYWGISKNEVEVCKECEFRHMCTDCRAFLKQPDNIYSQPAKCNYNPYIGKWKGELGFIPVDECGDYNKAGRFELNKEKVEAINLHLWGE